MAAPQGGSKGLTRSNLRSRYCIVQYCTCTDQYGRDGRHGVFHMTHMVHHGHAVHDSTGDVGPSPSDRRTCMDRVLIHTSNETAVVYYCYTYIYSVTGHVSDNSSRCAFVQGAWAVLSFIGSRLSAADAIDAVQGNGEWQ